MATVVIAINRRTSCKDKIRGVREIQLTNQNEDHMLLPNWRIRIGILVFILLSSCAFGQNSTDAGNVVSKSKNQGQSSRMAMQNSPAVTVALAHIDAWSHHDWEKTKELLAPDVHASVNGSEFSGIDNYMELKKKGAQLVEPGSVQVISAIGDDRNALISVTFRIGLGAGGAMVTMARSCRYLLDDSNRIKQERDEFFILSQ
jgi:hypothetical protein